MRFNAAMLGLALGAIVLSSFAPSAMAQRKNSLRHLLDTVEPDLKFTDVPLSEAINFIQDTTDANIVVDWKALEAVNIDRNTLVNMRLRNVSLRKALQVMLSEAGPGNVLTFYVADNVLTITTQEKADSVLFTVVYEVRDLLFVPPSFQLQDASSALSSLGSGGGGGTYSVSQTSASGGGGQTNNNSNIFSGGGNSNTTTTPDTQAAALVKLITDTVRPEIWKQNGGTATITYYQGSLIIRAPISVLEAIGGTIE